ncbi:UNVERIFIED_CONTAM: hypothetical protein HDU68_001049, partial [Siphonaria sp. JEL0065]
NFLGGYGSGDDDSDSEDVNNVNVKPTSFLNLPPPKSTTTASSTVAPKKKATKMIVLDALPDALSDDEDVDNNPKPSTSASSKSSGLFSFLPPPKSSSSSSVSATSLVPNNLRKRLANQSGSVTASLEPVPKKLHTDNVSIQKKLDEVEEESFFTLDLPKPKSAPLPPPVFKPSVSYDDDEDTMATTAGGPTVSYPSYNASHSSTSYQYTESASSSYVYNPDTYYASSHQQEPEDSQTNHQSSSSSSSSSSRFSQIHLDDTALHRLGHRRGGGGSSVEIIDLNHEDQLGGEQQRLENIKNMSREKVEKSAFEHLKPSRTAKQTHNIMALAYEAKAREHELKEAYADRRQAKAASQNKYGF